MFYKSSNYWEALLLLDFSWKCFSFPRKSCYDSRFLYLHQFLSDNFLACSLIWTFTSQSSCSLCLPPARSTDAMLHFRLRYSSAHSSGCIAGLRLSVFKVLLCILVELYQPRTFRLIRCCWVKLERHTQFTQSSIWNRPDLSNELKTP